jgi:cysteine desulfurase/selenocysteine lyase
MNHLLSESSLNEFNLKNLRKDFAILHQSVNGKPLVYLDNAATTQKPCSVLEAMTSFSQTANANIHRGVHTLSVKATTAYESARQLIAKFINAKQDHEIIFTSGTTEAINLVAQSFSRSHLRQVMKLF